MSWLANALMENRNGVLIGIDVPHATGHERTMGIRRCATNDL
ncbi:hypothetical protein [Dyella subtropica]|nr:hypothetical protein [Dyella subtropica]